MYVCSSAPRANTTDQDLCRLVIVALGLFTCVVLSAHAQLLSAGLDNLVKTHLLSVHSLQHLLSHLINTLP